MKKFSLALCLLLALSVCVAPLTMAANTPEVVYDGSTLTSNTAASNFGSGLENLLPGETATQTVTLRNTTNKTADFYLNGTAANQLASNTAAYDIQLSGANGVLYDSTNGGTTGNLADYQINGQSTQYAYVGSVPANGTTTLTLEVGVSGVGAGNAYQNQDGSINFQFMARQPDDPADRIVTEYKTNTVTQRRGVAARTGDTTLIVIPLVVLAAAIILIVIIHRARRKKQGGKTL